MFNDTISDVLTRIRNAGMVKHATVYVPLTRLSQQLCQILEKEGYINSFKRATVIQSANLRPPLIVVPKPIKRVKNKTSEDATDSNKLPEATSNAEQQPDSSNAAKAEDTADVGTTFAPKGATKGKVSSESESVTVLKEIVSKEIVSKEVISKEVVSEEAEGKKVEEVEEVEEPQPAFLVPPAVITPGSQPLLAVELKYIGAMRKPCITNLRRISKPGLRIYTRAQDIPKVLDGMGILILSTSKGLMTDREARARRLGGEILCSVW